MCVKIDYVEKEKRKKIPGNEWMNWKSWVWNPLEKLIIGHYRPFISVGSLIVAPTIFLIGYAIDLSHMFDDSLAKKTNPRTIGIFIVSF